MARLAPLLATALCLTGGGAWAASDAASEVDQVPSFEFSPHDDDVAVVIGVEKYRSAPASDFSSSDAKLFRDYLVAMGYPARNIELLTDDRATSGDMKRVLERWLPNKVKPESRVIVYFSGHGAPDPTSGKSYLVPWDGDPNYLEDTGYPVMRLEESVAKLSAKEVILILDACFSGAGKEGKGRTLLAEGARPLVVTGPEASPLSPKVAVLSAARRSQISASNPEYRHGLLTYHLLKAVREGKKGLSEIYETLRSRVEDDAKARNVEQTPSLNPEPGAAHLGAFLLADYSAVRTEAPKPKVDPREAAAFERERKKLEEAQKRMEEDQRRMQEKQEAAEKKMREEKEASERKMAEKERRMEAAAAERREAEERRRRQGEAELERRRRQLEQQGGHGEPAFIPPSF